MHARRHPLSTTVVFLIEKNSIAICTIIWYLNLMLIGFWIKCINPTSLRIESKKTYRRIFGILYIAREDPISTLLKQVLLKLLFLLWQICSYPITVLAWWSCLVHEFNLHSIRKKLLHTRHWKFRVHICWGMTMSDGHKLLKIVTFIQPCNLFSLCLKLGKIMVEVRSWSYCFCF